MLAEPVLNSEAFLGTTLFLLGLGLAHSSGKINMNLKNRSRRLSEFEVSCTPSLHHGTSIKPCNKNSHDCAEGTTAGEKC